MAATATIDFKAIFDGLPTPLMLMSRDFSIADMNKSYLDTVGRSRQDILGRNVFDAFPTIGATALRLKTSLHNVLNSARPDVIPFLHYPIPIRNETAVEDRYWSVSHVPILGEDGTVAFILQNAQDVTAMHRFEAKDASSSDEANDEPVSRVERIGSSVLQRAEKVQALNARLLRETAQLRNLFMRAPSFMAVLRGPEHRFELANGAFLALVGKQNVLGMLLRDAVPEARDQPYLALLDKVYRSGEPFVGKQMRAEFARTPGAANDETFINFVFQPIFGDDGRVVGIFVDGNDVTAHVRAEKSQAMLVRELHHRVRNTLATVQGVMNSTARTSETIEDYQWAFSGRISSLARTHSLLTEEIQQFVSFPLLLRQEVGVYADGVTDRVVLEGPDVELPSQLAVPLGMTIHELTTNAFRHGSLSTPKGRVTVTWAIVEAKDKRILTCRWIEADGPKVAPPARHGFGSMILTRILAQQIGAKVAVDYPTEGFTLTAEIPIDLERQ